MNRLSLILAFAAITLSINLAAQGGASSGASFKRVLSDTWDRYELSDAVPMRPVPEPDTLPVASVRQKVFKVVPVAESVDTLCAQWPENTDAYAIYVSDESAAAALREVFFIFYDTPQTVSVPQQYGSFHPGSISEQDVAAFWESLDSCDTHPIIATAKELVRTHNYNDWALLEWSRELSRAVFPANVNSEQTIFTVFLLYKMGLMVKMARIGDSLVPLFSSMQNVYSRKYVIIDTYPFYLVEKNMPSSEVYTYSGDYAAPLRPLDLRLRRPLRFFPPESRTVIARQSLLFNTTFNLPLSRSLLRFYEGYPQTDISNYALASCEPDFAAALTTGIGASLAGYDDEEKINRLLAFVQTDFCYKTDQEQFGYERPFFVEENFVFRCNDCEDRAVLFAYLVRRITSCKVVMLEYNRHISTAVCLPKAIKGDKLIINGEKYYVCDPSYIGATIGMTMPEYKNSSVKVYVI